MERLIGLLLRRRVGVAAFYALLVFLAGTALLRLPVSLLPSIQYPSLVVWTAYPEVAPEHLERVVTETVEGVVASTTGLHRVTSRSQLGGSLVRADFGWHADIESAALDIRQKLDRLLGTLPAEIEPPVVLAIDPSDRPILAITVGTDLGPLGASNREFTELEQIARDVLARRIEQVEGVARVRIAGGQHREIRIELLSDKLAAHGLESAQVVEALRSANLSLAGGTVKKGPLLYAVELRGEFRHLRDIGQTLVSRAGQPRVRLQDVARVHDGVGRRRGLVRFDDTEVLLLLVERRPEANTIRTASDVRAVLEDASSELSGVAIDTVIDESKFIGAAIGGSARAVLWGGFLAVAVLFVFIRRRKALLAVALAVPMSMAVTLVLFDALGVSLNLVSLSGLALGIGLLVDNAIVVVENIARWREKGAEPSKAARLGAAEVGPAITASTLTTVAVFGPLMFTEGLAGKLFHDQSLAVICALSASLFVALTLVPVLLSGASPTAKEGRSSTQLVKLYEGFLDSALKRRSAVLASAGLFLGFTTWVALGIPRENVPTSGQDRLVVQLEVAPEANLGVLTQRATTLRTAAADWPEVRGVLADLGERDESWLEVEPRPMHRGAVTLFLAEGLAGDRNVIERLSRRVQNIGLPPDVGVSVQPVETQLEVLLTQGETDLLIDLYGDQRHLAMEAAGGLTGALRQHPELTNVTRQLETVEGIRLHLDREAMLRFGVEPRDLESVVEMATRGVEATRFETVNAKVPIVVRAGASTLSIEQLLEQPVAIRKGFLPLATFLRPEPVKLPAVLTRHQQAPIVRITADIAPGVGIQSAMGAISESLDNALPPGVRGRVHGSAEVFRDTAMAAGQSLLLSLVIVYLILVAQFESLWQPLVILLTVPLAVGGVVVALEVSGQSWNLMSLTGCVVLVGIAVNDAILKLDFINRRHRAGAPLERAVREAGRERLRPILMTTATTALGLVPMALGGGQGAGLRVPLAIAVIGGLLFTTLFTLVAIPAFYVGLGAWLRPRGDRPEIALETSS